MFKIDQLYVEAGAKCRSNLMRCLTCAVTRAGARLREDQFSKAVAILTNDTAAAPGPTQLRKVTLLCKFSQVK